MSLFPNRIEILTDKLESLIPWEQGGVFHFGKVERNDWRPIWALCKEIQEDFKSGRHFKSREDQQAAWERFNSARTRASEICDKEKEAFKWQSTRLRDDFILDLKYQDYDPITDILFFFDPTTVEEMKRKSRIVKEIGHKLSENKQWMLAEHKNQVFERIQECRESHEMFWSKRNELSRERHEANVRRRAEFEEKQAEWKARVEANIAKNRNNLSKAEEARERTRDRISDLRDKLRETTSDKWSSLFSEWLSEAEDKLSDIEDSISRIESWIQEDEGKLYRS